MVAGLVPLVTVVQLEDVLTHLDEEVSRDGLVVAGLVPLVTVV